MFLILIGYICLLFVIGLFVIPENPIVFTLIALAGTGALAFVGFILFVGYVLLFV